MHRISATTVVALSLFLATTTTACHDITTTGTARIRGSAALQDAWGNDLADRSGVEVTVDGESSRATTDASGAWRLDGVAAGHHDVTFTKSGFGQFRLLDQPMPPDESVLPTVTLATTPTVQAIIDSIYVGTLGGQSFFFVDGHLSEPPPANAKSTVVVVFWSRNASVSPDPNEYEQWNASFSLSGASTTFTEAAPVEGTRSNFPVGTQVYVAGYVNSNACSCWTDAATGRRVFSNTGPRSNVVRFTIE